MRKENLGEFKMSLAGLIDFFVHELSNLCQTQLLPRCSVAAVSHLRGKYEKKLNTQTSEISASSDFTAPASVFLFLGTRALFFNFFPRNGNISMATGHRATIPPGMHAARLIH